MVISKSTFILVILACSLVFSAVGVTAGTNLQKITANLNHGISFILDGKTWVPKDTAGKKLPPISYQGSTYLPARALAEATGAEILWNGQTSTITINTSGGTGNSDGDFGSDLPSTGGSSNTGNTGNENSGNTSSSSGIMKLTTQSATEEKMRAEAQKIIQIYAKALKSGSTKEFDSYIDNYTAEKRDMSPISMGRSYYKKDFEKKLSGTIKANDSDTLLKFANTIENVKLSEIETSFISKKSEFSQEFSFKYYPEGWDSFSSVYVYFNFAAEKYDSDVFLLESVRIS
ncbi:stalk domain-containing protein [Paenibacillus sp. NPDC057967]|uniref:stalk domain-containing protein n=1 Tax=Paenibacillus sp. NPDC057967 TaxID=3346293 RepID=UPI0036DF4E5D